MKLIADYKDLSTRNNTTPCRKLFIIADSYYPKSDIKLKNSLKIVSYERLDRHATDLSRQSNG